MKTKPILGYVPYGTGKASPFDQVFVGGSHRVNPQIPETFDDVDAIVVWGGADISPSIYGDPVSKFTYADNALSLRDQYEVDCCKMAISRKIPIIGVCRGAQLLCALAGGRLVQHVSGHAGCDHAITTYDGKELIPSSVHHQMLYPWYVDHQILAVSKHRLSSVYDMAGDTVGANKAAMQPEPEIVYFPQIRGLAIQGHPEFMETDDPFVAYCNDLVHTFLLNKENSHDLCCA